MSVTNGVEDDVIRIKKKLEKMMKTNDIDVNTSIDMLNMLKNLSINLQILQNTRIGVVVNSLRKNCSSDELGTLAKSLLKSWKRLVEGTSGNGNGNGHNNSASPNSNYDDRENSNSTPKSPVTPSSAATSTTHASSSGRDVSRSNSTESTTTTQSSNVIRANSTTSTDNSNKKQAQYQSQMSQPTYPRSISFTDTRDPVRIKSRELLEDALKLPDTAEKNVPYLDAHAIACRCEDEIFNEFKNTEAKYKNRMRSRLLNLKDAKNPKLRENVRRGYITPEHLAVMTAEDMASDNLKQLREKYTKEAINDHQMGTGPVMKSSLLKCGKCKKNNCSFSEAQTRSADEPMTVFAWCNDCGHRWKQ